MACGWKRNEGVDRTDDLCNYTVGGCGIIGCDKVPDFVEVTTDFWVEIVGDHSPDCWRRAAALFALKWATISSREMGLTLPLLRSS